MVIHIDHTICHFLETEFQRDGALHFDYVRVRLLWNIDAPLRFQRVVQFGDEASILKFRYEKLCSLCSICKMMTHEVAEYPANNNCADTDPPSYNDEDDDDEDHPPGFLIPSKQYVSEQKQGNT